jgi:hypothetical protein
MEKKIKPISPKEVQIEKLNNIPEKMIEVVNSLIVKKFSGYSATILEKDIVAAFSKETGITSKEIYDNHYLDFEDLFRKAGWVVEYDKPGYNETYSANYTFKKKK